MIFLDNKGITDPHLNLAIEEYALKNLSVDDDYLLFYINRPSIIIGKNQVAMQEINQSYVEKHQLPVVRRLSGGGAVYHDLGNLNFSFITNDDGNSFHNFRKFTEPVVTALRSMGVNAELSGRNDLQVDERKISGNAQFASKGRMFNHGTLMFNLNIENLVAALNVKQEKILSKGIQSVRSRVANISEFLVKEISMEDFRKVLLQEIFQEEVHIPTYQWTETDWRQIKEIAKTRYQDWDWNYGKSPQFDLTRVHRFPIGQIDIRLNVTAGKIADCKIYGDFFGQSDISELEQTLVGTRYDQQSLALALRDVAIEKYFGDVTIAELIELICG